MSLDISVGVLKICHLRLDVNVGDRNQQRVWKSAEGLEISVEKESGGLEVSGMIRVNLSCQFLHPFVIKAR